MTSDSPGLDPVHLTRGFLFADLRGYSSFVEAHGDQSAARLLESYRRLVRATVGKFGGAEVKTEGDSFYVVFPSASGAVSCGLAIVAAADSSTVEDPKLPIHVGVGVHAGETADTQEGYVGSAVNVAARVCGLAAAGEVLVTDTVRGLTRTTEAVRYEPRGRRRLKGIPEPMTLYAAFDARSVPARHGISRRVQGARTRLVTGPVSASLVLLAAASLVLAVVLGIQMVGAGGKANPPATGPLQGTTGAPASFAQTPASSPSAALSNTSTPSLASSPSAQASPPDRPPQELPICPASCEVSAGIYREVIFPRQPLLVLGSGWSYSLSGGVDNLDFWLTDRPESRLELLAIRTVPGDACASKEGASGLDQTGFLSWLRSQKALAVGSDVLRRFPQVNAVQVDIAVDRDRACKFGSPPYVTIQSPGGGSLPAGFTLRAYVFDLGSDLIVAIIQAPTSDEFAIFVPDAEAVLASLDFDQ